MYPFDPKRGQRIQSSVLGVAVDHAFVAHFQVAADSAVAADTDGIHAAITLAAEAQAITTGIANPAVPRSLSITGNAVGNAGNVVITGTNYADEVITETIALNGNTAVLGNKAFKTVTKIDVPAETHAGTDTVIVGWGEKLGLPFKLTHNTVLFAFLDNTKEGTAPTVTTSATAVESNTIDLNSALNGKVVDVYLLV